MILLFLRKQCHAGDIKWGAGKKWGFIQGKTGMTGEKGCCRKAELVATFKKDQLAMSIKKLLTVTWL